MIRPDKGKYAITQGFGDNKNKLGMGPAGHDGIDLGAPLDSSLYAPRDGVVKEINRHPVYGLRLKIDNGKNIDYLGHLSDVVVKKGEKVVEGQLVAHSGESGKVTGPHVHWGVYKYDGTPVNSLDEFDKVNQENVINITDKNAKEQQIRTFVINMSLFDVAGNIDPDELTEAIVKKIEELRDIKLQSINTNIQIQIPDQTVFRYKWQLRTKNHNGKKIIEIVKPAVVDKRDKGDKEDVPL